MPSVNACSAAVGSLPAAAPLGEGRPLRMSMGGGGMAMHVALPRGSGPDSADIAATMPTAAAAIPSVASGSADSVAAKAEGPEAVAGFAVREGGASVPLAAHAAYDDDAPALPRSADGDASGTAAGTGAATAVDPPDAGAGGPGADPGAGSSGAGTAANADDGAAAAAAAAWARSAAVGLSTTSRGGLGIGGSPFSSPCCPVPQPGGMVKVKRHDHGGRCGTARGSRDSRLRKRARRCLYRRLVLGCRPWRLSLVLQVGERVPTPPPPRPPSANAHAKCRDFEPAPERGPWRALQQAERKNRDAVAR
eukprot:352270-Chlamydomonas_euryale.AAC.5